MIMFPLTVHFILAVVLCGVLIAINNAMNKAEAPGRWTPWLISVLVATCVTSFTYFPRFALAFFSGKVTALHVVESFVMSIIFFVTMIMIEIGWNTRRRLHCPRRVRQFV